LILFGTAFGVSALIALWVTFTRSTVDAGFPRMGQGMDGDAVDTIYTNSKYGISALQPGNYWDVPIELSGGNSESTWRADRKAHWGFSVRPASVRSPSDLVNAVQANPLVIENSAGIVSHVMYAGYPAIRLETTIDYQAGGVWREVFYVFVANDITYLLEGGTPLDEWDKGGKADIANLLDSVTIAHQAVVLDPTPAP
jgi:hypothetical protein